MLNIPLMADNISRDDIDALCTFLQTSNRFTNGPKCREFERKWAEWLGVKYCVFVNSGASANLLTMYALKTLYNISEVAVPVLTWSSDIASVYHCGLKPKFFDIDLKTLAMEETTLIKYLEAPCEGRKVVFLTHILGLCGLSQRLLDAVRQNNTILVEDVCESHGATFGAGGGKLGTFGLVSNFSFYYAHHMSTIEGGMICTDDEAIYETVRMLRSHGMTRECDNRTYKDKYLAEYPDVHPEFTFALPGFNCRSTELNAVIGLNQLRRLDRNNEIRRRNYELFLNNLDASKYFTDFKREGNCNYALTLLLRNDDKELWERVKNALGENGVEYRCGMSGGGNMLRQPFIRERENIDIASVCENYPNVERVHNYGMYLGNYPTLPEEKILRLCEVLNKG